MNIEALFTQAQEYEDANNPDRAVTCYHEILALNPQHVPSLTRLGVLALSRGNTKEAGVMLKWARKLAPTDPDVTSAWDALHGVNSGLTCQNCDIFQSTRNKADDSQLNILFVQNSPCIRNYKMATALRSRGHRVTLGYTVKRLSQRYSGLSDKTYDENIHITSYRQLWDISRNYDLLHSHNEPDELTVAALAGDCPVIHDTHDLISLRANNDPNLAYFEGIANRGAHGRIATTPFQEREIMSMYGPINPGLVFYNYASEADLPRKFHPKLSARDDQVHFVYEGGLSESAHRDFRDTFVEMAVRGLHVHIYPADWSDKLAAFFSRHERIHYNKPVSPKVLMEEMTRYDIGIIPWNLEKGNKRFLDSTIANKLFEYLAAGLPVATSRLQSYEDFFERTPVGVTFESVQELVEIHVPRLLEMAKTIDFTKHVYTFESEIQRVEEFYRRVLKNVNSQTARVINKSKSMDHTPCSSQRKKSTSTSGANASAIQGIDPTIQHTFDHFSSWLMDYGWDGYDPYDVEDFIMNLERQGQTLSDKEKQNLRIVGQKDPMTVREKFNIPKKRIAKGLGLLTAGWSRLYKVMGKNEYLWEAQKLAQWLMENPSPGYANLCWGYPFDWQSVIFIPKHTPSAVVSTAVGDGLWELFSITRDEKYLEACASICRFIANDLNRDDMGKGGLCFSYTPIDDYHVHNANLFCGEFLARIGKELDQSEWLDLAARTADYAIAEQNPDGSIYYWGRMQNHNNPNHLDHYHTGFEIRCLFKLHQHLNSEKIRNCYERYLDFYQRNFLDPSGLPKQNPKRPLPVNIHGAAECILLNSTLSPEYKDCLETAERALKWTIKHMQTKEGWFAHLWSPQERIDAPYLRWGQAWMLRAYAEFFDAKKNDLHTSDRNLIGLQNQSKAGLKKNSIYKKSSNMKIITVGSLPPEWGGVTRGGVATSHHSFLRELALFPEYYKTEIGGVLIINWDRNSNANLPKNVPFLDYPKEQNLQKEWYLDFLFRERPDFVKYFHIGHCWARWHIESGINIPAIGSVHSWNELKNVSEDVSFRARKNLEYVLRGYSGLIFPSDYTRREGLKLGFDYSCPTIVIPNALSSVYRLPKKEIIPLDAQRKGIIFVGSLIPLKRADFVLKVAARLKVPVTIVGDGPERENLEFLSDKLGIKDKVHFTGQIGSQAVRDHLLKAYLLCVPSTTESFGNVYLEAFACGTPVVGFAPTIREIASEMGIPVGIGVDGSGTFEDCLRATSDVLQTRWNRLELKKSVEKKFSPLVVVKKYINFFYRSKRINNKFDIKFSSDMSKKPKNVSHRISYEDILMRKEKHEFELNTHISLKNKYIYFQVSKSASSTIKYHLQKYEYTGTKYCVQDVNNKYLSPHISPFQVGNILFEYIINSKEYKKICFVRNPYTRILSCYLQRIIGQPEKGIVFYNKSVYNIDSKPSFRQFVEFITHKKNIELDGHWRPQYNELLFDIVKYDFVGKFENLRNDLEKMSFCLFGKQVFDRDELESINCSPMTTTADKLIRKYYDDYAAELVCKSYSNDFDAFEYDKRLPY